MYIYLFEVGFRAELLTSEEVKEVMITIIII